MYRVVSTILLQSFWNNVEVFILGLCIGGIVMFFYRLFIGQELEDKIHKEPNKYHNFHHVIIWDEVGIIVSAIRTVNCP